MLNVKNEQNNSNDINSFGRTDDRESGKYPEHRALWLLCKVRRLSFTHSSLTPPNAAKYTSGVVPLAMLGFSVLSRTKTIEANHE